MPLTTSRSCDGHDSTNIKCELQRFDREKLWSTVYERLKNCSLLLSKGSSVDAARDIRNRWKNRYRDINPYDSTRVLLFGSEDGDYINASFVNIPEVPSRRYILTQGPTEQTVAHFWLMIWERRCPVIVMLNRFVEKGSMKCHPYFPLSDSIPLKLDSINICVHLESEVVFDLFVRRVFCLLNTSTNESHTVIHMHYTSWPDFGVPTSPSGLLSFLWSVRSTGALDDPHHPVAIHCSAGVGRSGAFVLIDLGLCLIERDNALDRINLGQLFVALRQCRMGIIQTPEQLRFCYEAVIKGAEKLLATAKDQRLLIKFDSEAEEPSFRNDTDNESDITEEDENVESDEYSSEGDNINFVVEESEFGGPQEDFTNSGISQIKGSVLKVPSLVTSWFKNSDTSPPSSTFHVLDVNTCNPKVRSTGTRADSFKSDVWADRILNEQQKQNSLTSLSTFENTSLLNDPGDIYLRNRSNNALPVLSNRTASLAIDTASRSSNASMEQDAMPNNPDGDSPHFFGRQSTDNHVDLISETAVAGAGVEVITDEYIAASIELHERRLARRTRQARMRERIEHMREQMRAADMERKRWLPSRLLCYLRRFYAESGYVQSVNSALMSTLFIIGAVTFVTIVFLRWYSDDPSPRLL